MTESSQFLGSLTASVDIYALGPECRTDYQGTIDMNGTQVRSGLPVGQTSYLVFNFVDSSLLGSSTSSITYDVVLTPVPGRHYRIDASYADNIYDVLLFERDSGAGAVRQIDLMADHPCFDS